MKRIKIFNKKLVKIFLILIFLSMLILNYLTPILADDYSYSIESVRNSYNGSGNITTNLDSSDSGVRPVIWIDFKR